MPHDWRSSYLTQAKSDYAIFAQLVERGAPLCHSLHYLQMTTEKLAKGLLTASGGVRYAKTHGAFLKLVKEAKNLEDLQAICGFNRKSRYMAYLAGLLPLAAAFTTLQKIGAYVSAAIERPPTTIILR